MNWLATLNESQLKAVIHPKGPLFVVAGAGTGKTRTLTTRIAYLIMNQVEPKRILAVTFTNKAAREMKERVIEMTGPYAIDVWLYTFHAFGLKILRSHIQELPYGYLPSFTVIDEEDGRKIIHETIKNMELDTAMFSIRGLKNLFSLYKTKRILKFEKDQEQKLYDAYQKYLQTQQLLDFDDLLMYTLELLENHKKIREEYQQRFDHILVDEFQDTDQNQYKILKILADKHKNLFAVGDPDQSIYSFRGAHYLNNQLFLKDFQPESVVLEKNYRSTTRILNSANQLISFNTSRPDNKNLESDLGEGLPVVYQQAYSDYQETFYVINEIKRLHEIGHRYRDIAILYRNNALSRLFEDTLIKEGMPYIIYGGLSFYERKEIKDALAYIRLVDNPNQDFYFKRIVNIPRRGIGLKSIQTLEEKAREMGVSLFEAIDEVDLRTKAKTELLNFKAMILKIREEFSKLYELNELMPVLMHHTGYLKMLKEEGTEIAEDRINNLRELQSVFRTADEYYEGTFFEKLKQQLDQIALYTDLDQDESPADDFVILSTIHQVKGLEFKIVFMVVMEEGIFPSEQSINQAFQIEEERRVAYVGMTRAKERLYLTYASQRLLYGQKRYGVPSRFIGESNTRKTETPIAQEFDLESHYLAVGDKVNHQVFGLGVVVSVKEDIATIAFGMPYGIKQILESHPSIKKIKK